MLLLFLLLVTVQAISDSEINYLQDNFFASLRSDPKLKDNVLTTEKKEFIDEQVENFIGLIKKSQDAKKSGRQKRSFPVDEIETLSRDKYGVYMIDSVKEKFSLQSEFARDIIVFEQNNELFAAALETDEISFYANKLRIYQNINETFDMIHEREVNKAVRLSLYETLKGTFIAIAENRSADDPKSTLYLFQTDRFLKAVQSLNVNYVSDILIWGMNDEIFMAACQQMQIESNETTYDTVTIIYKWLGKHFDIIQSIPTYNAQKIAFIGNANFLAIANNRNDRGESNIFSTVFKYDLDKEEFLLHQNIATKSARDVKFFSFVVENFRETFLVVANHYDEESNEEANSIVYKYVDDYFIPFQSLEVVGATEWLPVVGLNGEFVLLASSVSQGVKIFQYDGWRFVESKLQRNHGVFGPGVTAMHSIIYNKTILVAISNENNGGEEAEIVEFNFVHRNMLMDYREKTLSWCKSQLGNVLMGQMQQEILGQPQRADMPDSSISNSEFEEEWQPFNSSDKNSNDVRLAIVDSSLDTQNVILQNLDLSLRQAKNPIFTGNVIATNVIINNGILVENLFANKLNNVSMPDFTANLLTTEGIHIEKPLYFSDLTVNTLLNPTFINKHSSETLMRRTDDFQLKHFNADGVANFNAPITLRGKLNDISISNETIVLKEGRQYLKGNLRANEINVENFETSQINRMDLKMLKYLSVKPLELQNIKNLTVDRLFMGGLLNDVDIGVLDQYTLKIRGDQEIKGNHKFTTLEADEIQTRVGVVGNFVRTDYGEYWIDQDVFFVDDVSAEFAQLKRGLNHIQINSKGSLDVFVKNTRDLVYVNGLKEIENVRLGEVRFRGKILSKLLEKINPVKHIQKPMNVTGDYVFKNGMFVEKFLQAKNVANKANTFTVQRLRNQGLKINDENVSASVRFLQQIKVARVAANTINGINVSDLVVTGSNTTQVIDGMKYIKGDLYVTGSTKAININNVDLKQLEETTMKTEGDQNLTGKFILANVNAKKIDTTAAQLGVKFWLNVLTTDGHQNVAGKTIVNNLKTNHFEGVSITCNGLVNTHNFTNIVADTITSSDLLNIASRKHFINLTIDTLTVGESHQKFQQLFNFVEKFENIVLPSAEIENLTFDGSCNEMTNENFNKMWSLKFDDDVNFENVTVFGGLLVDSDYINDLKIEDLVYKTVKRNEEFYFETGVFDGVLYSAKPVLLKGHIHGVNLADLTAERIKIRRAKTGVFNEINVGGTVFFGGYVAGFNTTELCNFAHGNNENKTLIIEGSTQIANDLQPKFVNKFEVDAIKRKAWFKNQPTNLTGYVTFDEIHFSNNITCSDFVGGISLKYLSENYFSRTADQNVSASLEFTDVLFQKGLAAPKVDLAGNVNDLDLKQFLETALLDGIDQFFEKTVYLDECNIKGDINGEYLVNDMDLQNEVMRYDVENAVTGLKNVTNIKIERLNVNERTFVQEVPLNLWIKNSILKTGSFNMTGSKSFDGFVHFKGGINVRGSFNGVFVNKKDVMLKKSPQTVTGTKTFAQNGNGLVEFKKINLSGNINGIRLNELIENQIYKNQDSVIDSALNFNRNVTTSGVYFEKSYNGVNVTDFVKKVVHFAEFNNIEVAFQNLLYLADTVEESLKRQAYYLSTYEISKSFYYHPENVIPVLFADGFHRLAVVYKVNDTTAVGFYIWDSNTETFIKTPEKIQFSNAPIFTTALNYADGDYFYMESYNSIYNEYVAEIAQFLNDTTFTHTEMHMEPTKSLSSLTLNDEKCFVAVFLSKLPVTVMCNVFSAAPEVFSINSTEAIKAITITIENSPYIITINLQSKNEESSMNVWKYDIGLSQFSLIQTVYVAQPNDVAVVAYKGVYYIAVASGYVPNTMYAGSIEIYRYHPPTDKHFTHHQTIKLSAPIQLEFAVLPTQELFLFALTETSTKPLIIYEYSGISGFAQKIVASGIGKSVGMKQFTIGDGEHFLVLRMVSDVVVVLRAVFKGQKLR